jgi:hypothetical protein
MHPPTGLQADTRPRVQCTIKQHFQCVLQVYVFMATFAEPTGEHPPKFLI